VKAYWKLTGASLRAFARDRGALFWIFFFPIFFMLIFGLFLGHEDEGGVKFRLGLVVPDTSPAGAGITEMFKNTSIFEVHSGTLDEETKALKAGQRRAVVVFPPGFSAVIGAGRPVVATVYYDPSQPQTAQAVTGIVRQMIEAADRRITGRKPLLELREEPLMRQTGRRRSFTLDFLLPGILAMMLMQVGLFTAIPLINLREKGILKRLGATGLPRWVMIGSQVTQRVVLGIGQTAVFLAVGFALFHFHVAGSWALLLALIVFGVLTFVALGAVLASVAKTQESGTPMVQLVNLPMMFLSGLFFPPEVIPGYLRPLQEVLPATHLADALRSVTVAAPAVYSMPVNFAVMAAWGVVCLMVAARFFRWE
jgi:ABC-2 type transport system permease protein